jgi:hypothetical protein
VCICFLSGLSQEQDIRYRRPTAKLQQNIEVEAPAVLIDNTWQIMENLHSTGQQCIQVGASYLTVSDTIAEKYTISLNTSKVTSLCLQITHKNLLFLIPFI